MRGKIANSGGILTVLGIAIGVASVMIISEISRMGTAMVEKEILNMGMSSIVVTANKSIDNAAVLDKEKLDIIKNISNENTVSPFVMNYSEAQMRGLTAKAGVLGVDANFHEIIPVELKYGRLFTENDIGSNRRVCLIDDKMARDYYHRENVVGKTAEFDFNGVNEKYEIIGVVKSGGTIIHSVIEVAAPYIAYAPYTSMNQALCKKSFNQIAVKTNLNDIEYFKSEIDAVLNKGNIKKQYNINDLSSQSKKLEEVLDIVRMALSGIAGISLVVSGLSIMTVMLIYVKEKTMEIGIKKAIGARKSRIVFEFIIYACNLTVKGILFGVGCALSVLFVLTRVLGVTFSFDLMGAVQISLIAFVISIVFSAYPAFVAASLNPIDALRME